MEKTSDFLHREGGRMVAMVCGQLIYAFGLNLFIVPNGLYSGGFMGFSMLIRTFLISRLHLSFGSMDIAGLIYYCMNLPVLFIAKKYMGRVYLLKTLITVTACSLFLVLVPVPAVPMMKDALAMIVIGGVICGTGCGLTLRQGTADGGMDMIGIILLQKSKDISIGRLTLFVNLILYGIMLFVFDVDVALYSLIYSAVCSFTIDHVYSQSINVEVHIITKKDCAALEKEVFEKLERTLTKWQVVGAYSGAKSDVLYVIVNKYELGRLRRIVQKYDPDAFLVANSGVRITGHYAQHLN